MLARKKPARKPMRLTRTYVYRTCGLEAAHIAGAQRVQCRLT